MSEELLKNFALLAASEGGIAKLRELILSLAVRGKLVPQDPKDEPANVLLKRIRAEKERLVAECKIKQDKVQTAISENEKPYRLPASWEWVRFGEASINRDGERIPVSSLDREKRAKTYDYYGASGVIDKIDGYLFDKTLMLIGEDGANLINRSTPIAFLAHGKYWVNNHAHVIDTTNEGLMLYLCLFINAISLESYITGTAQPKMNQAKLNSIVVALPPSSEQSRIVAKVESLMALCDRLEEQQGDAARVQTRWTQAALNQLAESGDAAEFARNWQALTEHFDTLLATPASIDALDATLLQLAVRGKLAPQNPADKPANELLKKIRAEKDCLIAEGKIKRDKPLPPIADEEKPFELPEGWTWSRFPELGEFGRGKSKHRPRNDATLFNPAIYPLVQTGEVSRADRVVRNFHSKYSELGLAQSKMWPAGTLCITIAANIAESAILGFDACFPDSVVGFVPAASIGDARYFLTFIETARTRLLEFAPSTAQKNINLEILQSILIPTPPIAEMQRIVAKLDELLALTRTLRARLSDARAVQARLASALVDEVAAC